VSKLYAQTEVDRIVQRNRWLYHFRNMTGPGSVDALRQGVRVLDWRSFLELISPGRLLSAIRARWRTASLPHANADLRFRQ
jgi:hypothetical protein